GDGQPNAAGGPDGTPDADSTDPGAAGTPGASGRPSGTAGASGKATPGPTRTTAAGTPGPTPTGGGTTTSATSAAGGLKAGTYTGTSVTDKFGKVTVTITVAGGQLTNLSATYVADSESVSHVNGRNAPTILRQEA